MTSKFPSILGLNVFMPLKSGLKWILLLDSLWAPTLRLSFVPSLCLQIIAVEQNLESPRGTTLEGNFVMLGSCILGIPKIPESFTLHIVNIRFLWGRQKDHFPNCICSQTLIWIIQLTLDESTRLWANLKFFEKNDDLGEQRSVLVLKKVSTYFGEQNQVGEHRERPIDTLQLNQWPSSAFPNSFLQKTKPLKKRKHLLGLATNSALLPLPL